MAVLRSAATKDRRHASQFPACVSSPFHKLLRPPSPRSAHLFLSVLARTPAGYSSRICSFPTRKPATQPPLFTLSRFREGLVPQGAVRAAARRNASLFSCQRTFTLSLSRHPLLVAQPQVAVALPRFCFFSSGGTYRLACANSPSSSA